MHLCQLPPFPLIHQRACVAVQFGDFILRVLPPSGRAVAALPRLCVLDVSCNTPLAQGADGGGFERLAASLSHAVGLHTLRLQACGLTADSLKDLGVFSVVWDILLLF